MIAPLANSLAPLGSQRSPAFAPTWIAGLRLWLRADAGTFTDAGVTPAADGDLVQQWNDQSGNAFHAAQPSGAARPVYQSGVVNGRPVVRFDGVAQFLLGPDLGIGDSSTFFVVVRKRSASGSAIKGIASWAPHRQVSASTTYGTGILVYGSQADAVIDLGGDVEEWNVLTLKSESDSSLIGYLNGSSAASFDPYTPTTYGEYSLGSGPGGFAPGDWDIAEMLVYDTALADADREATEAYLATRYG